MFGDEDGNTAQETFLVKFMKMDPILDDWSDIKWAKLYDKTWISSGIAFHSFFTVGQRSVSQAWWR